MHEIKQKTEALKTNGCYVIEIVVDSFGSGEVFQKKNKKEIKGTLKKKKTKHHVTPPKNSAVKNVATTFICHFKTLFIVCIYIIFI